MSVRAVHLLDDFHPDKKEYTPVIQKIFTMGAKIRVFVGLKYGVKSPLVDAEVMLMKLVKCPDAKLIFHGNTSKEEVKLPFLISTEIELQNMKTGKERLDRIYNMILDMQSLLKCINDSNIFMCISISSGNDTTYLISNKKYATEGRISSARDPINLADNGSTYVRIMAKREMETYKQNI